ncbi:ATP-binding protein [Paraneptunicella aestuarii]|uniref:ATP-binding protein n=1 Tax=Paraneptunicella aestuarii TaxID=2831148 RepID=UPI001E453EDF|nr:ATP-binding protein [Paraneptunicella aestuarii]UAA39333.1 ATP-binding protein [Paraneptunicella aestuarii]
MPNTIILKRYLDLFILAIVVFALFKTVANVNFVQSGFNSYVRLITELHWIVRGLCFFSLLLGLRFLLTQLNVIHPKRKWLLRNILIACKYPPVYVAAFFCIAIYAIGIVISRQVNLYTLNEVFWQFLNFNPEIPSLLLFYIVFKLLQVNLNASGAESDDIPLPKRAGLKNVELQSTSQGAENKDVNLTNEEQELLDWLEREIPLTDEHLLMFNRDIYVERITSRYQASIKAQHLALCGDYGMGKSTVANLVCKRLEKCGNWVTVKIDSWGRNPDSIGSHILNHILEKLSELFDTSALQPLPENYRNALQAKGDWFSAFSQIMGHSDRDFNRQLETLDGILHTLDIKMLLVLEDIDRNPESEKMVSALASMIDRLNGIGHIHFIITISYTDESANIIGRVCNYREDLSGEVFIDVFDKFLTIWIKRAALENVKLDRKYSGNLSLSEYITRLGRWNLTAYDPFNTLVNSPRKAKAICRRVNSIWQKGKLLGELDLFDLLVMQVIRETQPHIYDEIKIQSRSDFKELWGADSYSNERNAGAITLAERLYGYKRTVYKNNNELRSRLSEEEAIVAREHPVLMIVALALPIFSRNYQSRRIQRLSHVGFSSSYFDRFERETLAQGELSDQSFIRELVSYQYPESSGKAYSESEFIIHLLINSQYQQRLEHFSRAFQIQDENKRRLWYRKFLLDVLIIIKGKPKKYLQKNIYSVNPPYGFELLDNLFNKVRYGYVREESLSRLRLRVVKFLMCHFFDGLHCWLCRADKVDLYKLQKPIIHFVCKAIENDWLHREFVYGRHRLLAYSAKEYLSWDRESLNLKEDSTQERKLNTGWHQVIRVLIDKSQKDGSGVHYLVIAMFFFLKMHTETEKPELHKEVINEVPLELMSWLREHTLKYSPSDFLQATSGGYHKEIVLWFKELTYYS